MVILTSFHNSISAVIKIIDDAFAHIYFGCTKFKTHTIHDHVLLTYVTYNCIIDTLRKKIKKYQRKYNDINNVLCAVSVNLSAVKVGRNNF